MTKAPKSKDSNMLVQSIEDELMLYDLERNVAYCLNKTSAMVYQLCDGQRTITEISGLMSKQLKSKVSEEFVWLALDGLRKDELLVNNNEISSQFMGMSRREIVRKVGLASMIALPIIANITAPQAAAANSGCPPNPNLCQFYIIAEGGCSQQNVPSNTCVAPLTLCGNGIEIFYTGCQ